MPYQIQAVCGMYMNVRCCWQTSSRKGEVGSTTLSSKGLTAEIQFCSQSSASSFILCIPYIKRVGFGMTYVALSRVTSLAGLHIIEFDCTKLVCDPKAVREYNQLRSLYIPHLGPIDTLKRSNKVECLSNQVSGLHLWFVVTMNSVQKRVGFVHQVYTKQSS